MDNLKLSIDINYGSNFYGNDDKNIKTLIISIYINNNILFEKSINVLYYNFPNNYMIHNFINNDDELIIERFDNKSRSNKDIFKFVNNILILSTQSDIDKQNNMYYLNNTQLSQFKLEFIKLKNMVNY